jgi:hypothetical protein
VSVSKRVSEMLAEVADGADGGGPPVDAPIASHIGKMVESGVFSPHTAASYIEDLERKVDELERWDAVTVTVVSELNAQRKAAEAKVMVLWEALLCVSRDGDGECAYCHRECDDHASDCLLKAALDAGAVMP